MQLLRKYSIRLFIALAGIVVGFAAARADNGGGGQVKALAILDGSRHQIAKDSSITVEDSAFYNSSYAGQLDKSYTVQNAITVMINEASTRYMHSKFNVTIKLHISWLDSLGNTDTVNKSFTIGYDSSKTYNSRSSFVFQGAHKVTVKVISDSTDATGWDPLAVLLIENQLTAQPAFHLNCNTTVSNITVSPSADITADELPVSWNAIFGAEQYDLEWTYVDKTALDAGRYGPSPYNPTLIFRNSATRITTTGTSYNIPIIYDDSGTLFIRVRSTQSGNAGSVTAAMWSSDASPAIMGAYTFTGHERPLNWQSNISFAEEGKRKVVVQYFDGSLRGRQTVTKDNTTNTTIVGETYYDYQGRPAIQVMPAPTLKTIIGYTAGFNISFNSPEYSQSNYDTLVGTTAVCDAHADSMANTAGASLYYSPNNPQANIGLNQFIPDAQDYPFTETEYTPDNTGRIHRQSGVGVNHQLGSGHETKYYYDTPDQNELDALFGTEVGDKSHYFKNMVRDANGQYSVSYIDMHGRTIATALAGNNPSTMAALPSNNTKKITETLADSGSVSILDQSMISQKSLAVAKADTYNFHYSLLPDSLHELNCNQQSICYTCRYDLDITITDDCNNNTWGGQAYTISRHNFSLSTLANSCNDTAVNFDFSVPLPEGSFLVTKKLTINRDAYNFYRDSIYLPNNTCTSIAQFITQQKSVIAHATTQCTPDCSSCKASVGDSATFLANYNKSIGLAAGDPTYKTEANAAYKTALDACSALCQTTTAANDVYNAMLQDMTPPFGQYADTLVAVNADKYSVFYVKTDDTTYVPAFQLPTIQYHDENGKLDSVYNTESGLMVAPNSLTRAQFVQNFRSSWAVDLLPYHPEYCRLQVLENNSPSLLWDRQFEATDTYAAAVAAGYNHPLSGTGVDPLTVSNTTIKGLLNKVYMTYKTIPSPNISLSMWGLAAAMVKSDSGKSSTVDAFSTSHNIDDIVAAMCPGDQDMVWRNFRELYQGQKQLIFNQQLLANPAGCQPVNTRIYTKEPKVSDLAAAHHQSEFSDVTSTIAGTNDLKTYLDAASSPTAAAKKSADLQDSLNLFYDNNSAAYARQWFQQLTACTLYTPADTADLDNVLIPGLRKLCRQACDADHPFGASSLPAGQTIPVNGFNVNNFQDIINHYNQSKGINDPVHCNAELITAPLPYDNQPVYSAKPVFSRPSDCECGLISSLNNTYKVAKKTGETFSAWLLRTQQITMTEADLDQLILVCGNTTNSLTCRNTSQPILLPPAMQCHTGQTCSSCHVIDSLYSSFRFQYPSILPSDSSDADTAQAQKNVVFQNFMNNRLGYNLQSWEYLQFMDSCKAHPADTAGTVSCSPTTIAQLFNSSAAESMSDMRSTSDGGYILAGRRQVSTISYPSAYLLRYNKAGNIQWAKTYSGSEYSDFLKVRMTSDNGFVALGTAYYQPAMGSSDTSGKLFVVRTDGAGNQLWQRSIGFSESGDVGELGFDIIQTRDSGYIIVGDHSIDQNHEGHAKILVVKLNSSGNLLWANALGNSVGNDGYAVAESPVGDTVYVIGRQNGGLHNVQGVVMKINEATGVLYKSFYVRDANQGLNLGSVVVTGSGLKMFNFASDDGGGQNGRMGVMTMALDGTITNSRRLALPPGNPSNQQTGSLAVLPTFDGGWLIGETGQTTPHIYWAKLDQFGNAVSTRMTNLSNVQTIGGLVQNPDSTVTALGTDSSIAMLLNLSSSGSAGCKDSLMNLAVSSVTLTKDTLPQGSIPLTSLAYLNGQLTEQTLTTNNSIITCPGSNNCYPVYNGPILCGKAAPLFGPAIDSVTNCSDSTFFAVSTATSLYKNYSDSLTGDFEQRYLSKCIQAYRHETFTVTHTESEYHYTLYYYDQAGNLLKTVPPAGVQQNTDSVWLSQVRAARAAHQSLVPAHTMVTNYRYNSLNQVVAQNSPDGGTSYFWYDRLGRLAVSQNGRQKPNNQYSYTQYDTIGRITQVGQLVSSMAITDAISRNEVPLLAWENNVLATADQITVTNYDDASSVIQPYIGQRNVRNRVSWTGLFNTAADMAEGSPSVAAATYYSYDILGNVDTLLQDYGGVSGVSNPMNTTNNRFKKIVYDFDLVSGKVNKVAYQHGRVDAFYHTYLYDAENRITNVQSSTDSVNWDNDAFYSYYAHGPLARTVLGQQQVQGINYAYNLPGWLKSINPAPYTGGGFTLRPDSVGNVVANNAYSLLLNYFDGDYKPISPAASPDNGISTTLGGTGGTYRPLYNGNISSMGVEIKKLNAPVLYNYQYDQLNRLMRMDAWNRTSVPWNAISPTTDYQENITYDPNGNILTYRRNADNSSGSNEMDKLKYWYPTGSNQLDHISDTVTTVAHNDISSQSAGNYKYDPIGELVSDDASNITNIAWTVYGKIDSIEKAGDTTIKYTYDASGHRISKAVKHGGNTETTWYVRDGQGNVLSIYTSGDAFVNGGLLAQTELDIYGSGRLGIWKRSIDVHGSSTNTVNPYPLLGDSLIFTRGNKLFELSNHLGNVLVTISDKRCGIPIGDSTVAYFNSEVVSANDYYPFGMLQSNRSYAESNVGNFRYGFNGKEQDAEVKGTGKQYDYGERTYDPRISRWLSLDALQSFHPYESNYSYVSNNPILYTDKEGREKVITINIVGKNNRITQIKLIDKDFTIWRADWIDMTEDVGYRSERFDGASKESVYETFNIDLNNPKNNKHDVAYKIEDTYNYVATYWIAKVFSSGDQSSTEKYGIPLYASGTDTKDLEDKMKNPRAASGSESMDINSLLNALQAIRDLPTEGFSNPDMKDFLTNHKWKEVLDKADLVTKALDAIATANGGKFPTGKKDLPPDLMYQDHKREEQEKITIILPPKPGAQKDTDVYIHSPYGTRTDTEYRQPYYVPKKSN